MTLMTLLGYVTIGLVVGWLSNLLYGHRGIRLVPSLAFGVAGALAGMFIIYVNGLAGAGYFAMIGAMGILFTVNTFRQKKPLFDEASV